MVESFAQSHNSEGVPLPILIDEVRTENSSQDGADSLQQYRQGPLVKSLQDPSPFNDNNPLSNSVRSKKNSQAAISKMSASCDLAKGTLKAFRESDKTVKST